MSVPCVVTPLAIKIISLTTSTAKLPDDVSMANRQMYADRNTSKTAFWKICPEYIESGMEKSYRHIDRVVAKWEKSRLRRQRGSPVWPSLIQTGSRPAGANGMFEASDGTKCPFRESWSDI